MNFEQFPQVARALVLFIAFCIVFVLVMLCCPWFLVLLFAGVEFHEGNQFCSTQVVFVRSLSSFPRVLGLWVGSSLTTTLRYAILTRTFSGLTAMRRFGAPSVPGFVVLLAPLQPSSCWFSRSRWVDFLVPSSRDGCISGYLAVLRLLPPPAAGNPAVVFLVPPEGCFIESNCVLAWLGLSAGGFLVASNGSIYFGPEFVRLGLSADGVFCLYTQDPVAHCLIHRCVFHSCLSPCFNFVLLQTCRPCLRDFEPFKESFSTR